MSNLVQFYYLRWRYLYLYFCIFFTYEEHRFREWREVYGRHSDHRGDVGTERTWRRTAAVTDAMNHTTLEQQMPGDDVVFIISVFNIML